MNSTNSRRYGWPALVAAAVWIALAMPAAFSADPPLGSHESTLQRAGLWERVRERIEQDAGLAPAERARMEQNLRRCLRLELRDEQIEGLFPGSARGAALTAQQLIALQDRVAAAGEAGLAADLLADKVREGRMKRAGGGAIDAAVERLEQHLRQAERQLAAARESGVAPAEDPGAERRLQRGLALDLWRGLAEGDLDRLRDRAEQRARDGSCSIIELAAAAETATELQEIAGDRTRAVDIAELGLARGLSAAEIRRLGRLAQVALRDGESPGPLLDALRRQLRAGATVDAMMQHMLQHGWLGPRDMGGPAGRSPVDNVIDGPGRHGGPQGPGGDEPSSGTGNHGGGERR